MKVAIATLVILLAGPAMAQQHQHKQHLQEGQSSYAGLQQRTIKALGDQQLSDLRAGRGMGLALAAELNGYPGPIHVIELADHLQLSAEQRLRFQQLYEAMKAEAIAVGEKLIAHETALDRQFAGHTVSEASLASLTAQIGEAQAELRTVHLKYHLTTAALLTVDQLQRYAELRGYR
jgi:hypothetical protein